MMGGRMGGGAMMPPQMQNMPNMVCALARMCVRVRVRVRAVCVFAFVCVCVCV